MHNFADLFPFAPSGPRLLSGRIEGVRAFIDTLFQRDISDEYRDFFTTSTSPGNLGRRGPDRDTRIDMREF